MSSPLKLIRKELGLTQEELGRRLGITKSALSMIETGKQALSERNKNILVQDLNVNPDWFDTGRGPIFNAPPDVKPFVRRTDNTVPFQSVPLYNIEATAGLVPLFTDSSGFTPVDHIHIPNVPRCDGAIYVAGDSMYPLLKSGDIVLYKQINNIDDVFWGDMYLLSIDIDGEEYVTVKYIQRSDRPGHVRLVSQNSYHADKDVAVSKIRAIALIKASIRMNSMH
ncbi:MAG: LexA family transcriptional regulator [Rikenellaceae bacterium]|nr:LexA family transcriptional regulator [Rikenellaceae bacterium]MCL2692169.1 LexA family transcriptional regulator [Rikenellaceae bacterium]